MIKSALRLCRQLRGLIWKCLKWTFFLTLPLTALPLACGLSNSFYYAFWQRNQVEKNTDLYLHELKDLMNDWGVSEMTFRDYQDKTNDFHVLRLNSNDWVSKLGFIHPEEYHPGHVTDTPINNYGDLNTLMLDTRASCGPPPPKEQWVYLSDWAWPSFHEWDRAFVAAVEAGYVPSALNETRLFYAECQGTAGFLCGIWNVRASTLLHFLVEDDAPQPEDIHSDLTYSPSLTHLRPVTVRVVEFPLQDTYTGLPSSVFPGPKEQMLAIMRGDKLYEQFEPWEELQQSMLRFDEYLQPLCDTKGTYWYYLTETDNWITKHVHKPLGLEDTAQIIHELAFLINFAVFNFCVLGPWLSVKRVVLDFFGYPLRGDWILGDMEKKDEETGWPDLLKMPGSSGESLEDMFRNMAMEENFPGGEITTSWGKATAAFSTSEPSTTANGKPR